MSAKAATRERVPPKVLKEESRMISLFCLLNVMSSKDENHRIPVAGLFEAYQDWLEANGYAPTAISVDGFGRLLPKVYTRKTVNTGGGTSRYVIGVELSHP